MTIVSRVRRNPYRRRRNGGGGSFGFGDATRVIGPALIGAAGAFGLNYTMQYLPLPASMQSGVTALVVEAVGGILFGVAAGSIAGRTTGIAVSTGALTVVGYQVIAGLANGTLMSGSSTTGRFVPPGARLRGMRGLGFQNPARVVGFPATRLPRGTQGFPVVAQRGMQRFVPQGR